MSLKNLNAKNKIPKILKEKLNNKKINLLYKKFENAIMEKLKIDKMYTLLNIFKPFLSDYDNSITPEPKKLLQ